MRLDDLPNPSRRFVACVSASTATVDSSPGRGGGSRAADYDFASVFAVPTLASEDSAQALAATTSVAQPTPSRSSVQGTDPVEGPPAPVSTSPGSPAPQTMTPFSDRISTRTRRRSATAAGKAPPAVDYGFGAGGPPRPSSRYELQHRRKPDGRGRLRPSPRPLLLPTRRPAQYHLRSTTTTQSLWELLSYGLRLLLVTRRLHVQGRMPLTTLLNCGSRIPSRVFRMPIESENRILSGRAMPRYVTSLSAGGRPCRPTSWNATTRSSVPPSQISRSWRVRVDYMQPTTTSSYSFVTRHCHQQGLTSPFVRKVACLLNDEPVRIYDPLLMRPWIMQACHSTASCHLGTTRTWRMVERFYWWIGMNVFTRWWIRHCLKCQARKTPRLTVRWPIITMPIPEGPGVAVSFYYFGPFPVTPRGNTYHHPAVHRSLQADMFPVTAAEFTVEGTANILVNQHPLVAVPAHHTLAQRTAVLHQAFPCRISAVGCAQACYKLLLSQL